ncbi:MAG TPA: TIGR03086 family metal-binding protein [Amycolatopsis sp.]|nr:TIGR03086 family metal-binding protein [Amycolatopsis sp.]
MDTLKLYERAQDQFDAVLAQVRPEQWEAPSECAEWSVRDVAGHVIWGQYAMKGWATGETYTDGRGAPGSPQPRVLAGEDPLTTWRIARKESVATLSEQALSRRTTLPGLGEVPLSELVTLLITDHVAHAWDIGHPMGMDVRFDPALVTVAFDWSRGHVVRRPGFFGPEVTPPADAGEQERLFAFLGR